jgi:hypothetical protein
LRGAAMADAESPAPAANPASPAKRERRPIGPTGPSLVNIGIIVSPI